MIEFCMLGCGGTYPLVNRHLASSIIRINGVGVLFDCGEATQIAMQKTNISFKSIDIICITHLHADHISGLMGVLLAINTSERTESISILGPIGIDKFIKSIQPYLGTIGFNINCFEIDGIDSALFEEYHLQIDTLPVKHSGKCLAYSVKLNRRPSFLVDKIQKTELPKKFWNKLCKGQNVIYNDIVYNSKDYLSIENRHEPKIVYMTDTRPCNTNPNFKEFVKDADLFIVEGMYKDDCDIDKARQNKHMTWKESISMITKDMNIREVILTHFSPSLRINKQDDERYLKTLLKNATLGYDGLNRIIKFDE